MTLKNWIEYADPSKLIVLGDSWITFGADLEHLFDTYVDAVMKVNGTHWEGQCAQAAQQRAQADQKTMQALADKIETVAQCAKQGYDEIDAPLRRARGALIEADRRGYTIADTLALSIPPGKTITDGDKQALLDLQAELNDAVRATVQADSKVRDDLSNARAELRAAFVSTAALGSDQAKNDGTSLAGDGILGPEGVQRLIEAGQLTPEQVAALQRGETSTIPASQMEYLNGISQSLDGKSPQEVQQIMSKLPPDAQRALANSLQIVSNPSINAGPVAADDKGLPNGGKGGLSQLPAKMRESLTRDDLVTNESKYLINNEISLNGVADNQAIAKIIGTGDPQYQLGSDVDRKLLEVGSKYLDGYEQYKHSDHDLVGGTSLKIDGGDGPAPTQLGQRISEDMFAVGGRDKEAVEELVTGPEGEKFLNNMFTHQWSDEGQAVSTMFDFGDHDATVEDPGNPADVQAAERTGKIMSSVGQYIAGADGTGGDPAERWKELTSLQYGDRHTAGALNPKLIQEISQSMSPYVDTLAGHPRPELPGFDVPRHVDGDKVTSWLDPQGNGSYQGAANIFALMNTDAQAGADFNGAAMLGILRNEAEYANNPFQAGATAGLTTAGRLNGLMDAGLFMHSQAEHNNEYADAKDMYERRQTAYDAMKAIGSRGLTEGLSGGKFGGDFMTGGGEWLKANLIGPKPDGAPEIAELRAPDFIQRNYEVLTRTQVPANLQNEYPDLFENGSLKPWTTIKLDPNQSALTAQANELFNSIGRPADGHGHALRDAWETVTGAIPSSQSK
ncbi:TPR repeat region-containing protein [Nocardia xishanensis]